MIKKLIAIVFFNIILLQPATLNASELIKSNNIDEIVKIARNYGSATKTVQPNGNPKIIGKIDNIPFSIRFRNCKSVEQCQDMNFRVGFMIKPSLDVINEWNRNKRFSKAYLDETGDVILEWDIIIYGGLTSENLDKNLSYWRLTLTQFTKHIGFK